MVLLGIDPGFLFAGFGIIKYENRTTFLLECGCLKMTSAMTIQHRIGLFHNHFQQKITQWGVTDIVIETPFLGKNAQNFLKLGYLRGILYLLAEKNGTHMHEFSPREIKQAVTGWGGASKDQVATMMLRLFPRLQQQIRADVTDALAVALCGLWRKQHSLLIK
jgi:crossover junction endodeoxyribonuclease RuvC